MLSCRIPVTIGRTIGSSTVDIFVRMSYKAIVNYTASALSNSNGCRTLPLFVVSGLCLTGRVGSFLNVLGKPKVRHQWDGKQSCSPMWCI